MQGSFEPNLINSVVFLVSNVQSVCVICVNYKGRPFMKGLTENSWLLYSIGFTAAGVVVFATNMFPFLGEYFQLVPFPSDAFQNKIMLILIVNAIGTFVWDRFMMAMFSPEILRAVMASVTRRDVQRVLKAIVIIGAIVYYLADEQLLDEIDRCGRARCSGLLVRL